MRTSQECERIFAALHKRWPDAHCELAHNTPFQLLIAVVLSAQATDVSVNRALYPLLQQRPNFSAKDLVQMGETGFYEIIRSIGLAKTKAGNCYRLARRVIDEFSGEVPDSQKALESLPGVGRKTANVVRNVLFGEITMPVDTHVERLAIRLGLVSSGASRLAIEQVLLQVIPKRFLPNAHHVLIFHGRYLCQAKKPSCETCPVLKWCPQMGIPGERQKNSSKTTRRRRASPPKSP